ncbi:MAG: hypothetical protein V4464_15795 [Pseudomonadota bacterium]
MWRLGAGKTGAIVALAMLSSGCNLLSAKLPESEAEASRMCWPAASVEAQKDKVMSLAEMAEVMTYAAIAAKSEPGTKSFIDKTAAVTNAPVPDQVRLAVNSGNLLAQCRARFPHAAGTPAPTLPTDAIDRGMWCIIASDDLAGAMIGAKAETYPEKDRLARVSKAAVASLNDPLLATRGITSADQFVAYREKLGESVMQYRLDLIAAACPDTETQPTN